MLTPGDVRCEWNRWLITLFLLSQVMATNGNGQFRDGHGLSVTTQQQLPFTAVSPVLFSRAPSAPPDLALYHPDSSGIVILSNNGKGEFQSPRMIARTSNVTSITVGNINNDGMDDLVIVHRETNTVEVLTSRPDSVYMSRTFTVGFYPERAVIADITNDRRPDIISFGKLSSGLSVLQGSGNGTFRPFISLFENIPISECSVISLNGDRIPDIAIHNWLQNETVVYLGVGGMKYSEQTVLSFAEDSVQTCFADFNGDRISDVAVLSVQNSSVQIFTGDGLGNFSFTQAIPVSSLSHRIQSAVVAGRQATDLLVHDNDRSTMALLVNRGDGSFYDEIVFGAEHRSAPVLCGDLDGNGYTDLMIISPVSATASVVWNQRRQDRPGFIAVGKEPTNLYVNDVTRDGLDDIAVSNEGSSTISFLRSTGNGFSGHVSVETPARPVSVSLYARSDSSVTFFTSHREDPKIALITLKGAQDSAASLLGEIEQFSIALPERPSTVLPDVSFMQRGISLYAFMSTAPNAIVFYQQVKGTRFLAKSLVPLVPSRIMHATISDLNDDGKTDLIYLFSNPSGQTSTLGVTLNDSLGEYKGAVSTYPLPDTVIRRGIVFIEDMNGDQRKDCLVYSSPSNTLRIALGVSGNHFGPMRMIIDSLPVRSQDQIQFYDADNDGVQDILFLDRDTGSLWLFRGFGNGSVARRTFFAQIPPGANYRCGDFNGDGKIDIVHTVPNGQTIGVIYGS